MVGARGRGEERMKMNKKKLVVVVVVVALIVAFFVFDLGHFLSLDYIKSRQAELAALYAARPALVVGVYALIYVIVFALALPVGAVMTLAAARCSDCWN